MTLSDSSSVEIPTSPTSPNHSKTRLTSGKSGPTIGAICCGEPRIKCLTRFFTKRWRTLIFLTGLSWIFSLLFFGLDKKGSATLSRCIIFVISTLPLCILYILTLHFDIFWHLIFFFEPWFVITNLFMNYFFWWIHYNGSYELTLGFGFVVMIIFHGFWDASHFSIRSQITPALCLLFGLYALLWAFLETVYYPPLKDGLPISIGDLHLSIQNMSLGCGWNLVFYLFKYLCYSIFYPDYYVIWRCLYYVTNRTSSILHKRKSTSYQMVDVKKPERWHVEGKTPAPIPYNRLGLWCMSERLVSKLEMFYIDRYFSLLAFMCLMMIGNGLIFWMCEADIIAFRDDQWSVFSIVHLISVLPIGFFSIISINPHLLYNLFRNPNMWWLIINSLFFTVIETTSRPYPIYISTFWIIYFLTLPQIFFPDTQPEEIRYGFTLVGSFFHSMYYLHLFIKLIAGADEEKRTWHCDFTAGMQLSVGVGGLKTTCILTLAAYTMRNAVQIWFNPKGFVLWSSPVRHSMPQKNNTDDEMSGYGAMNLEEDDESTEPQHCSCFTAGNRRPTSAI